MNTLFSEKPIAEIPTWLEARPLAADCEVGDVGGKSEVTVIYTLSFIETTRVWCFNNRFLLSEVIVQQSSDHDTR